MLDADERVPVELQREMQAAIAAAEPRVAMFRMRRKDHLFGRWIRGSSGYPTWFGRLMRIGSVRVERAINEEYHADGEVRELEAHLNHFPFNKGFAAWIEKHDRYSTMEAGLRLAGPTRAPRRRFLFGRCHGAAPRAQADAVSHAGPAAAGVHRAVFLPRRAHRGTRGTHLQPAARLV